MKNRTIYDVLEKAMENYSYSIKRTNDRKVEIRGSIIIPRIDVEVTHELTFWYGPEDKESIKDIRLIKAITTFKEELKDKVVSVIKEHKEELTDDEAAIKKLLSTNKFLKEALSNTETELKKAREEIAKLELEKIARPLYEPSPWTIPTPVPNTTPWITWETQIGDQPDWLGKNIISSTDTALSGGIYENFSTHATANDSINKRNP